MSGIKSEFSLVPIITSILSFGSDLTILLREVLSIEYLALISGELLYLVNNCW